MTSDAPVLAIDQLSYEYAGRGRNREPIRAVDDVSLRVRRGEVVGVVGESGSGKSTLARCALRLLEPTSGRVHLLGVETTKLGQRALRPLRQEMHMVLQDTLGALNPRMTIGRAIAEPLRAQGIERAEREERTRAMLARVGLRADLAARYPHQLSGGQRQRVGIARALVRRPSLLVADEPVSALDVSVRASVLNLLSDLQGERGFACLFISHDLTIVEHVSDHVIVMYLGQVVEEGSRRELFARPQHPYTQALMSAAPVPDPVLQRKRSRIVLRGDIPSPATPPSGCRFRTRCPVAFERCAIEVPQAVEVLGEPGHFVRCHRYGAGGDVPRIAPR
jgi:oligopeptide transport system ATP-binding protein